MRYDNFDLLIEKRVDGHYPLRAHSEKMGEAEGVLSLQPESAEIAAARARLTSGSIDSSFLMSFGGLLYDRLFQGKIRDLFNTSLGQSLRDDDSGLRIRLSIEPPEISALPWELLYDQNGDSYLATSIRTPLTRYLSLFEPIKELKTPAPLKVLVVIPEGSGLNVGKERAIVDQALARLGNRVVTRFLEGPVTRSVISQALTEERYHVFHFIGHGTFEQDEGYLVLNAENDSRAIDAISAPSFSGFFKDYPWLRLIVLNSCQGAAVSATRPLAGMAAQLVRRGVQAVIAMQYPIQDKAAILFAKEFYSKLCTGWDSGRVDVAVSHARNRMYMDFPGTESFVVPVLFLRSPTGMIFSPEPRKEDRLTLPPVDYVHSLKESKKTHEANIAGLKNAQAENPLDSAEAIAKEKQEISVIDTSIRGWYAKLLALPLATGLVFFASWIGLFNVLKIDEWQQRKFIEYMSAFVVKPFSPEIALIEAEGGAEGNGDLGTPGSQWRQHHAELIPALARAGAKVVALDIYFKDPSEWDGSLGQAIEQATAAGTVVVIGTESFSLGEGGLPLPGVAHEVRGHLKDWNWGLLTVGGSTQGGGTPVVRMLKLGEMPSAVSSAFVKQIEVSIVPAFPLQVVMQAEAPNRPSSATYSFETDHVLLRSANRSLMKSIPSDERLSLLFDPANRTDIDRASRPYYEVFKNRGDLTYLREAFRNKIVLIGYKTDKESFLVSGGERRYGVEIQANMVSELLRDDYIRPLRPWFKYLIILLMGSIGLFLQTVLRRWTSHGFSLKIREIIETRIRIPSALLLVAIIYLIAVFQIYKNARIIFDITYDLAALVLTYWMVGVVRRGVRLKGT